MPRRRTTTAVPTARPTSGDLVELLADELKADRESGQPVIYERVFPTQKTQVTVLWDRWDQLPLEARTRIILQAYQRAEPGAPADQIALASGLTFPEAHAADMLPFQIITALRKGDPVSPEDCRQAMIAEGASTLLDPELPQLRFASEDEAEAARRRLANRLPGSEPVWTIVRDVGKVSDWYDN